MVKRAEGKSPQVKHVVWIRPPAKAFTSPRSLHGIALAVLATASLLLAAFLVYLYQRRNLRSVNSRARRGRGFSGLPQPLADDDVVYDDVRRVPRPGPRRSLPWPLALLMPSQRPGLFPDSARGFSFPLQLDRLWNGGGTPVVELTPDELAEVVPYGDGGWPSGSGPRFLATTASGKSLQVVVKTAAVAARQPQQPQNGRQASSLFQQDSSHLGTWQGAGGTDGSSKQQLSVGSAHQTLVTASASLQLTPRHSDSSGVLQFDGVQSSPYSGAMNGPTGGNRGPSHASTGVAKDGTGATDARDFDASTAAAGAGSGLAGGAVLDGSDDDGYDHGGPPRGRTQHTYRDGTGIPGFTAGTPSPGPRSAGGAGGQGYSPSTPVGPPVIGAGGAGGGKTLAGAGAGASPFSRGAELDPAVAWYSRALHKQVSAAAAAAQAASAAAPKAHLA